LEVNNKVKSEKENKKKKVVVGTTNQQTRQGQEKGRKGQ
jgi:hypothetical protein